MGGGYAVGDVSIRSRGCQSGHGRRLLSKRSYAQSFCSTGSERHMVGVVATGWQPALSRRRRRLAAPSGPGAVSTRDNSSGHLRGLPWTAEVACHTQRGRGPTVLLPVQVDAALHGICAPVHPSVINGGRRPPSDGCVPAPSRASRTCRPVPRPRRRRQVELTFNRGRERAYDHGAAAFEERAYDGLAFRVADLDEAAARARASALGLVVGPADTVVSDDGAVELREVTVTDPLEGRRFRLVQVAVDELERM